MYKWSVGGWLVTPIHGHHTQESTRTAVDVRKSRTALSLSPSTNTLYVLRCTLYALNCTTIHLVHDDETAASTGLDNPNLK